MLPWRSLLTLPYLESRRFLVHRDDLLPRPLERSSSGHVSPGVPSTKSGEGQ
jgi:hypothetical protein